MAKTRTPRSKLVAPAPVAPAPACPEAQLAELPPKSAKPTKLDRLAELLKRPEGATIAQMQEITGWQAHSVRGALAGALKARLSVSISSRKEAHGRVYWLTPEVES